jgi:hypothetical protein
LPLWVGPSRNDQLSQIGSHRPKSAKDSLRYQIEAWRNRPVEGRHPYVYLDGIVLKRSWAREVRNVSLLVAISVNEEGYREILGIVEGAKEDRAGWSGFLMHLKARGLAGIELVISSCCENCVIPHKVSGRTLRGFLKKLERGMRS